ncbi:hypothetical protein J2T55_000465 [Methylohalomonas lacus]|uniref:Uncharacterized protein n=1 Tax=Methylohalomonas lacus TaxID=398773 RepID=A0AAE3HJV8_9GAMM|nr:hypothetical protein [Methylohalomonas lacus]MCS3902461.1 hypothetical protein [Methylohalomonas lacus]
MNDPQATQPIVVHSHRGWRCLRYGLLVLLAVPLLLLLLVAVGVIKHVHERGFFAPVWGPDAAVYFVERETRGWVFDLDGSLLGLGSDAAAHWSWVVADAVSVRRLQPLGQQLTTLRRWDDTPVAGRLLRTSPQAVFGVLLATLKTHGGLSFSVNISVPAADAGFDLQRQRALFTGRGDNVIRQQRELLAVPGAGFYPAAIISTRDNRDYSVLLSNDVFATLYPDGLDSKLLQQLSRREHIETQQNVLARRERLIETYQDDGLSIEAARQRADRILADDGYRIMEPQLIAMPVSEPAADERVFRIDRSTFAAGHFADIAAAIARPGQPATKQAQPYAGLGAAALNDWLAADEVSWVVTVEDRYYRLLLHY